MPEREVYPGRVQGHMALIWPYTGPYTTIWPCTDLLDPPGPPWTSLGLPLDLWPHPISVLPLDLWPHPISVVPLPDGHFLTTGCYSVGMVNMAEMSTFPLRNGLTLPI